MNFEPMVPRIWPEFLCLSLCFYVLSLQGLRAQGASGFLFEGPKVLVSFKAKVDSSFLLLGNDTLFQHRTPPNVFQFGCAYAPMKRNSDLNHWIEQWATALQADVSEWYAFERRMDFTSGKHKKMEGLKILLNFFDERKTLAAATFLKDGWWYAFFVVGPRNITTEHLGQLFIPSVVWVDS